LRHFPEACELFKEVGCYKFCHKLQGYHQGIAKDFAKGFDGFKVHLGPVVMHIDEASVAAATKMLS
jgi:hypothetical protein